MQSFVMQKIKSVWRRNSSSPGKIILSRDAMRPHPKNKFCGPTNFLVTPIQRSEPKNNSSNAELKSKTEAASPSVLGKESHAPFTPVE
jgi:hypothetical protein